MFVEYAGLAPRERYKLLLPVIAPRPIAFVSSLAPTGAGNLAPFSFFTMGGGSPQSVVFCGEVVAAHFDDAVLVDGMPDVRRIGPVTRLGGDDWGEMTSSSICSLPRPQ